MKKFRQIEEAAVPFAYYKLADDKSDNTEALEKIKAMLKNDTLDFTGDTVIYNGTNDKIRDGLSKLGYKKEV